MTKFIFFPWNWRNIVENIGIHDEKKSWIITICNINLLYLDKNFHDFQKRNHRQVDAARVLFPGIREILSKIWEYMMGSFIKDINNHTTNLLCLDKHFPAYLINILIKTLFLKTSMKCTFWNILLKFNFEFF